MPEHEPVSNVFLFSGREVFWIAILLVIAAFAIGVKGCLNKAEYSMTREPAKPYLVPVNTASLLELESIPGIGPVGAKSIIEYRSTVGRIDSVEILALASGLSIQQAKPILKYITFDNPESPGNAR